MSAGVSGLAAAGIVAPRKTFWLVEWKLVLGVYSSYACIGRQSRSRFGISPLKRAAVRSAGTGPAYQLRPVITFDMSIRSAEL
jgi:hypothetical protein